MHYIEGIDISFWDVMIKGVGNNLVYVANWDLIRANSSHVRFMYYKATQGSPAVYPAFVDPAFQYLCVDTRNWVPRGCFHYFDNRVNGHDQAMKYLDTVHRENLNLRHVLDAEMLSSAYASVNDTAKRLEAYIRCIHDQTNTFPDIYTARWCWNGLPVVEGASQCRLWVANYGVSYPVLPDRPTRPWSSWTVWQWSTTLSIPGLVGGVDHDRFYGSEIEFQQFIQGWNPPPILPDQAIVVVNSLWIRNAPHGLGIGGLKQGDIVTVYETVETGGGYVWARISDTEAKWACMKITSSGSVYMRFI